MGDTLGWGGGHLGVGIPWGMTLGQVGVGSLVLEKLESDTFDLGQENESYRFASENFQKHIQVFFHYSLFLFFLKACWIQVLIKDKILHYSTGHNLTGIASQFAMHLGFTCDVISVTHRSD